MRKILFAIARSGFARFFIGFAFQWLTPLMPLKRIKEDASCILFLHPSPHWETHWLGVPKRSIGSFALLHSDADWESVLSILRLLSEEADARGIRPKTILVNGGHYQDVPQVHFHLAHGLDRDGNAWGKEQFVAGGEADANGIIAMAHPLPTRELHWQFALPQVGALEGLDWDSAEKESLLTLLKSVQRFVSTQQPAAYTLLFNLDSGAACLHAHLIGETN